MRGSLAGVTLLPTADTTLAVLAGGSGSRLGGVAKGLIELEGRPLIERHRVLAEALGAKVLIVTRRPEPYRRFGLPICTDEAEALGPAAGIVAGLRASTTAGVLFVGCDMAMLTAPVLAALLEGSKHTPRCFELEGELQPLPSLWWRESVEEVAAHLDRPLALRRLLALSGVEVVSERRLREVDPTSRALRSLNRPEDLEAIGARLPFDPSASLP